ncbi:MAG: MGMT family protein [Pseudomonadota bacterium]|uniref:MGMT family protein n=1 Tax=Alcanivorax sp. TaxID=1872427 RepID=UPI0025B87EC9|nr:MGMT family protein [Alcanivorax sp.]MED5238856.1 MGMT family protein [Pseudomonadota bacterium]MEE3320351.1 MGMT family protein [Pseudomonadota bacterium]
MNDEFRDAVYQIVAAIPAGKVSSYGAVARQAGFPRHARFVGRLMSRLPNDSRLPWHRVLRSDGHIALADTPAGDIQIQRLLDENVAVTGTRVPGHFFVKWDD